MCFIIECWPCILLSVISGRGRGANVACSAFRSDEGGSFSYFVVPESLAH